ncbi:hypothetical protein [Bdellovibrio sp. HCB2-146]|uniref:hypothetical protein n=1 Tax=Bdellovibrio sp. HCB2-146 TaxID=3394362 RepID=UPI0039BD1426
MATLFSTGCTLDARLIKGVLEEEPSIEFPAAVNANFVNQNLPTSLTKTKAHFGTISPQKYYFIQPGPISDIVRKFVKISGATKTELSLPTNVIAHHYAFSTASRIYYFSDEMLTPTTHAVFLRALDKATFTLVDFKCNGFDVDLLDHKSFVAWQEGAEGFYFRVNSANPAISGSNGYVYYSDGTNCVNTNAYTEQFYRASNKTYAIHADNIYSVVAGVGTLLRDGTNRPLGSGLVEYQGDLYFRADVDATAGTNYRLNRLHASTDDSVEEILTETAANFPAKSIAPSTLDGIHYYYCSVAGCVNAGQVYHLDMTTKTATAIYNGANLTEGRVLPFDASWTFLERGAGGHYFQSIDSSNGALYTNVQTNVTYEYGGTGSLFTQTYFPQYAYLGGTYFISGYSPADGHSVIQRLNPATLSMEPALTNFMNPYSMRQRGGELFFLAEQDKKIKLFRGDGTNGGTTAVTGITSDDYQMGRDISGGGIAVRRTIDLTKEGTDLYVMLSGKEKVYLAEYSNGQVKYVEIPGAVFGSDTTTILSVRDSQILIATPAHGHTGWLDTNGVGQHRQQPPGVQIVSYDGAQFTYWLNGEWALSSAPPSYYYQSGYDYIADADDHLVAFFYSPVNNAGVYMRRVLSVDKTTITDLFGESSYARSSTNGTTVAMSVSADTPANNGFYLQRAGVNQKITTTALDPANFRWDGDILYFMSEDSVDSNLYVWKVDTTQVTPVPQKISTAAAFGEIREDAWTKRVFKVGTDDYFALPSPTGVSGGWVTQEFNLWKVSGGVATLHSADLLEEIVPVVGGFYYISRPTSGPDNGKRCVRRIMTDGEASSTCEDLLFYLKPSPRGLTVSDGKYLKVIKNDMSLTNLSKVYLSMNDTDYDALLAALVGSYPIQALIEYYNYSAAGGKIFNFAFADVFGNAALTYRDSTGANMVEAPFSSSTDVDVGGTHAGPLSERARRYVYYPFYAPQANSLLFSAKKDFRNKFYIVGVSGPLDASPPP